MAVDIKTIKKIQYLLAIKRFNIFLKAANLKIDQAEKTDCLNTLQVLFIRAANISNLLDGAPVEVSGVIFSVKNNTIWANEDLANDEEIAMIISWASDQVVDVNLPDTI